MPPGLQPGTACEDDDEDDDDDQSVNSGDSGGVGTDADGHFGPLPPLGGQVKRQRTQCTYQRSGVLCRQPWRHIGNHDFEIGRVSAAIELPRTHCELSHCELP